MVDEIVTNPQRSEPIVDEKGLPTDQTIEWFDDIELTINELTRVPPGSGFQGPDGAVPDNLVSFGDATGDLGKDSGIPSAKVVQGPGTVVVPDNIVLFDTNSGKLIKDSSKSLSDFGDVNGSGGSAANRIATYTDASGKEIKDSGKLITDLGDVNGPVTEVVPDNIVLFNTNSGKLIKDSSKSLSDFGDVSGSGGSTANRVATYTDTSGKEIKDSGVLISSLGDVNGPAGSTNNRIATFSGAGGKTIKDSGVLISSLGDVNGPAGSTNDRIATFSGAGGKTIKDSGKLITAFAPAFRGALVYRTSNFSIPNSDGTDIPFTSEEYDTDNIHALNSASLVVPSGVSRIILRANITWAGNVSTVGSRACGFNKAGAAFTGTSILTITDGNTILNPSGPMVSPVLIVVPTNTFQLAAFQDSGGAINVLGGATVATWFSMEIVA